MAKHTLKSCGVNTARFLKYIWSFYNIMHERVNISKINGSVVELDISIQFFDEERITRAGILQALKCVDANWSF